MKCRKGAKTEQGLVPCGQCLNCRINRQRSWTSRILMEWVTHPGASDFVTLTYNDDHVPRTSDHVLTLQRSELSKWVENCRTAAGAFRYYAVGEYGDDSLRPHYHLALFSDSDSHAADIVGRWSKGFTSRSELNEKRAAYLANYCTKKLTSNTDERLEPNQEPEFRGSSRRPPLGAAFVSQLVRVYSSGAGARLVAERGDIERTWRLGGKILPIPRPILERTRSALGIPRLHSERLCHPGYYECHHDEEFAEWEPTIAIGEEIRHHAKKKANRLRYSTQGV